MKLEAGSGEGDEVARTEGAESGVAVMKLGTATETTGMVSAES